MKKILGIIAAAAVLFGCSPAIEDFAVAPTTTTEPYVQELVYGPGEEQDLPVPISFEWRRSQFGLQDDLGYLLTVFGSPIRTAEYVDKPDFKGWSKDNQALIWHAQVWNGSEYVYRQVARVDFLNPHWDPLNSGYAYADSKVLSQGTFTVPNTALEFDNCNSEDGEPEKISQSRAVTLQASRSTETNSSFTVDVGNKTGITLGGKETGGGLENELSVALGWKSGESKAESRSESNSETVSIDSQIDAGFRGTLTIDANELHTATNITYWGSWTGGVRISLYDPWLGDPGGIWTPIWQAFLNSSKVDGNNNRYMEWKTMDDFIETISGTNTETPQFSQETVRPIISNAQRLYDPASRHVTITAREDRTYGNSARYVLSTEKC